jgi:hypothetical protein
VTFARLAIGISCLLLAQAGRPEEIPPAGPLKPMDAVPSREPLDLLLTRDELRAIANRYVWAEPDVDDADALDQVTVRGAADLAPMRDPSQDVMGGIAAPFWAIAHPKDAWRIFVPIPPKDVRR